MRKPEFITFTGADDRTPPGLLKPLGQTYPVEFGILFSAKRAGEPRYPHLEHVAAMTPLAMDGVRFSAHLCGAYSRFALAGEGMPLPGFKRAQINASDLQYTRDAINRVSSWGIACDLEPILQCRGPFPDDRRVSWLFDPSSGRGEAPEYWPRAHIPDLPDVPQLKRLVGVAGGITPENVRDVVEQVGADATMPYWLDMESGVRTGDRFDIDKCWAVCRAVYGPR